MLSKNKINFIKIILLLSININFGCRNEANKNSNKFIRKNLTIYSLSKNYNVNLEKNKLVFNNNNNIVLSNSYFYFTTKKAIAYKNISLSNFQNNSNNLTFKLYINNKYFGKFKENDTISLNKKIFSITILFLTNGKENIYNAWNKNFTYKLIKSNTNKTNNKLEIQLSFYKKNEFNKIGFFNIYRNKFLKQKNKIKYSFLQNTPVTNIITEKKSQLVLETSYIFNIDGSFYIHQLKANKNNKTIIKDCFYNGNWNIKKQNSNNILELSGYMSGYFANKKGKYLETKYYNLTAIFNANKILSNGLLDSFYLDFPKSSFVNIQEFAENIIVETPYSTKNNFTGVKLYPCNRCYLRYEVAKDLLQANKDFNELKYKIKIFDCYRPFHVQAIMFKKFPVKGYVADSIGGSVHNRASAIDLSITDMQNNEIDMGSNFDDLSYKSNHNYKYFSDTILNNRLLLKVKASLC